DFNNGYVNANNTFIEDKSLGNNIKIYKRGTGSNCDIYIGDNYVPVEYVYISTVTNADIVLATQYVAKNVKTTVESIVDPSGKESTWYGPALDNDKMLVSYGKDLSNIVVLITSINPAQIFGEEYEEHAHAVAMGYDAKVATYNNARSEAMFRRGFRELYLKRDLTITEDVAREWSAYEEIDICLNGKTLTVNKNVNLFDIVKSGKLVITDCKGVGHFNLVTDDTENTVAPIKVSSGSVIFASMSLANVSRTLVETAGNGNVVFANATISDTKAKGALFVMNSANGNLTIKNATIVNNYNTRPIFAVENVNNATFENLNVHDNEAKASVLVKVKKVINMVIDGGSYSNNANVNDNTNTNASDGVVFNIDDVNSKVLIKNNAEFTGNRAAYGKAGAIFINSGTLNIDDADNTGKLAATFRENIANKGASIYGGENTVININKATFSYSMAVDNEGLAIYTGGKLSINNSAFNEFNKAGSIIHLTETGKQFDIARVEFRNNNNDNTVGISHNANVKANVGTVSFINNTSMGQGIFASGSNASFEMNNVVFKSNKMKSAMYLTNANTANTNIKNLVLYNNECTDNGIVLEKYLNTVFEDLVIEGNTVTGGSALKIATGSTARLVSSTSVAANDSKSGALSITGKAELIIENRFRAERN
ncbi:MAG: hypothetical protein II411_05615, partial [Lachnospiraceae bacterium]|nr:hypothetical protein [Lachnospiraceae bacterium]